MKLVIDIHEKDYQSILNSGQVPYGVVCAIMNGTPLPKGHGDLKDADRLLDGFYEYCKNGDFGYHQAEDLIKSSLTIIEADGGEEDAEKSL